ncbi:hypothetical protein P280DRAFT_282900 [Massarina eburnea CBS 473.64]|uniref:Uncharacterized protein n=1 Tax=Massarina eburnea CBS 473.64 TaxID=1395130 RepID=A0A6A6S6A6_9PLEO|nr:hypothetical protein P280DRAFT_282900 [Massarina eburnea CBS 473.64]
MGRRRVRFNAPSLAAHRSFRYLSPPPRLSHRFRRRPHRRQLEHSAPCVRSPSTPPFPARPCPPLPACLPVCPPGLCLLYPVTEPVAAKTTASVLSPPSPAARPATNSTTTARRCASRASEEGELLHTARANECAVRGAEVPPS